MAGCPPGHQQCCVPASTAPRDHPEAAWPPLGSGSHGFGAVVRVLLHPPAGFSVWGRGSEGRVGKQRSGCREAAASRAPRGTHLVSLATLQLLGRGFGRSPTSGWCVGLSADKTACPWAHSLENTAVRQEGGGPWGPGRHRPLLSWVSASTGHTLCSAFKYSREP